MNCPLCERDVPDWMLEDHHLRTKRSDKKTTATLCRPCHRQIHVLWTNTDLRDAQKGLDTVEGLLAQESFQKALGYIRKLAPESDITVRESKHRRGRC